MQLLTSRLGRITSGGHWIPEVDGLRFVAILSVVLYHIDRQLLLKTGSLLTTQHWYAPVQRLVSNGSRGVELFFVLSGFSLAMPFARHAFTGDKRVAIASYFLRRVTRLEPPYLFNLLILSLAILLYEHTAISEIARHFFPTAIYLHELLYGTVSPINSVTWTLEIEVQFYIMVPLLVLFYRIRNAGARRASLVAAISACIALNQYAVARDYWGHGADWIYGSVFFYLQFFLTGLLLSDVYLTLLPRWRRSFAWDGVGLLCCASYFYWNAPWDTVLLPPLLFLSFIGAFRGIYLSRFFRINAIALIGGMGYTIYLWHLFLIALFFKVTRHLHPGTDYLANLALQCSLLLPLILLVSATLYLLIERPCMNPEWPHILFAKAKAAAGRSAAA